jgi:hypothetical protein
MAKRKTALAWKVPAEDPAESPVHEVAQSTTPTYDPIEAGFFERGERGIVEPPIYLPREPMFLPLVGVLFLAGLTAFVLL